MGRSATRHRIATGGLWSTVCVVDTLPVVSFFTVVGALNEAIIARMAPEDILRARIAGVPILVITGRLYCLWRHAMLVLSGFDQRGRLARVLIESAVCLSFRLPVYCTIIWIGGATGAQIMRGALGAAVILLICGRPLGLWIDFCRHRVLGTLR